jgi:hypothetical protein
VSTAYRQGHAVIAGTGDGVDYLLGITGGEVLAPAVRQSGGEYDSYRDHVPTKAKQRLVGAGLLKSSGLAADQLHAVCMERLTSLADLTTDQFVTWYVDTALAGLDSRKALRDGADEWAGYADAMADQEAEWNAEHGENAPCAETVGEWPAWVDEWFARLLHGPKLELLGQLCAWHWLSAPCPAIPANDWATKLVARFERRTGCTVPRRV